MRAKLAKIFITLILGLVLLVTLAYVLMRSRPVQQYLVNKITTTLSAELGTKVSITGIDIELFKTIVLENVFVADQQQDTLFFIGRFKADIGAFSNSRHRVILSYLKLENAKVKFVKHAGQEDFNYEFFFRYFEGPPRTTPNPNPVIWTIGFDQLILNNTYFWMHDENEQPGPPGIFDPTNFKISDINAEFKKFRIIDDSLSFRLLHMDCRERSGVQIDEFKGDIVISATEMSFKNLDLKTPNSHLRNHFAMYYKGWNQMGDFLEKVRLEGNMVRSQVSARDIAYFTDALKNWDQKVVIDGKVTGTVANMKGKNVYLEYGADTYFHGDFSMKGLPDIEATYIDMKVKKAQATSAEVEKLARTDLPPELDKFGRVQFQGDFMGFPSDFVAYGTLTSDLGLIRSDLNLKLQEGKEAYSGSLAAENFDLGKLLNDPQLGKVSFKTQINGKGIQPRTMNAKGDLLVNYFEYNRYRYNNIKVDGEIQKGLFQGQASARDANIDFDFDGKIDFSNEEKPVFDFQLDLRKADLKALHLDTAQRVVTAKADVDFTGIKPSEIEGQVHISEAKVSTPQKDYVLKDLLVESAILGNSNRLLSFRADNASAVINGKLDPLTLPAAFQDMAHQLIPSEFNKPTDPIGNQDFTFSLQVANADFITELFLPDWNIQGLDLKGRYQSNGQAISFDLTNSVLRYQEYQLNSIALKSEKPSGGKLTMGLRTGALLTKDSLWLNHIWVDGSLLNGAAGFGIRVNDSADQQHVNLNGSAQFTDNEIRLAFRNSSFSLDSVEWALNDSNAIVFAGEQIKVYNFRISNRNQMFHADGIASPSGQDKLKVDVENFNLAVLNIFLPRTLKLQGEAKGNIELARVLNDPVFEADVHFTDVLVNRDTLGDLEVNSRSGSSSNLYNVEAKIIKGPLNGLNLAGTLRASGSSDNFNMRLKMPSSDIRILQNFIGDYVGDLHGRASADLHLQGSYDEPELFGDINLENISFTENYLKARLHFSTKVEVNKQAIVFNRFDLYDEKNNKGIASGAIRHKNFKDFVLDIRIRDMNDFHCLHTNSKDNSSFYGDAYVDGSANITGPVDDITIAVDATSRKNTSIVIPLGGGEVSGQYNFITFENRLDSARALVAHSVRELTDITLKLNLNLTRDAEILIKFDSQSDDRILARGTGNLRMFINAFGDFNMYGNYTIERGEYLFTLANFLTRNFKIKQGSTIDFDGDPMNAKLNVTAVYELKASPADLAAGQLPQNDLTALKNPVPVKCNLDLKGKLTQPEIRFGLDIDYLSISSTGARNGLQNVVRQVEGDQEELSRQVFALLTFNSFLQPTYSQGTAGGITNTDMYNSTVGNLVTNQINSMLNRTGSKMQFGVTTGKNTETEKNEFVVNMHRNLINDRLSTDVSVDAANPGLYNVNVQYMLTRDGRLKVRVFSQSTNDQFYNSSISTQGLGFFYRKEFEYFFPNRQKNLPGKARDKEEDNKDKKDK